MQITIKHLNGILLRYPDDTIVQLSPDEEGNAFYDIGLIDFCSVRLNKDKERQNVVTIYPDQSKDYGRKNDNL